jgi:uncharacterized protein (DUF305 family)
MFVNRRPTRWAVAVSLLAMAGACGGGSSTNNQTASINTQASAGNASGEAMASGPFAQSEMQMHERMMAATGANASETWVRKMIEHHRGVVEMSQVLISGGGDPAYVQMARAGAEKQQREIAEMERLLATGITGGPGEANPFGPVEQSMHQQMMTANGANLSESWARKMIAHHQGAIDMSETLIRQGGNPQVLAMARKVAQGQRSEIAHLEAMLRGEAMPAAGSPAATTAPTAPAKEPSRNSAAPTARQPSAAPKATPAPRPAQRDQATQRSAPRPEPTPAPKAACTPEHRAMGHC